MTHTPGPWIVSHSKSMIIIADKDDDWIAEVYNMEDAQLVAIAPELLEALRALVRHAEYLSDGRYKLENAIEHAKAAVAKATEG